MKHLFSVFLLVISIAAFSQIKTYNANINSTSIAWTGKKIGLENKGLIKLKSGYFGVKNGIVEFGKFVIDMNSMSCTNIADADKCSRLTNHLKNDDFFSVEKFPISELHITKVVPINNAAKGQPNYTFHGNLKIKGKTNPIQFPAIVEVNGNTLKGNAKFSIDRTKWGVNFNSGTIFAILAEKAISDNIDFEVAVNANLK